MRTATPLNIETQPGVGMSYVIRNLKSKKLVRASTTCQRDVNRRGSKIKEIRAFSGDEPFFTAKVGSLHTDIEVLKFLCGPQHKKCRDTTGTYEWTGISLSDARKQKLEFSEPGYVTKEEEAPKAKKPKKTKVEKVAKTTKSKRGRPAGSKNKTTPVAEVIAAGEVTPTVAEPVAVEAPVVAKPVQSDSEFEAELAADFEADHQKAMEKLAAK
jgi:hypothetical protein